MNARSERKRAERVYRNRRRMEIGMGIWGARAIGELIGRRNLRQVRELMKRRPVSGSCETPGEQR